MKGEKDVFWLNQDINDTLLRIIEYINKHEGVEWMTFGEMAKEFKEGEFPGAVVEDGRS